MIDKAIDHVQIPETPANNSLSQPLPEGALLNERQIQWLRRAVVVMTAILVGGIILLVGRVIYLARNSGTQAAQHPAAEALAPALLPEVRLQLPSGASVKSVAASGSRLTILHTMPDGGEGITVLDLATGKVASRVLISR